MTAQSPRSFLPVARRAPSAAGGDLLDQLDGGLARVQQGADVGLRTAQWLEGRHPHERLATDVEDDGVPRCGCHLFGPLVEAAATEVGACVVRWLGLCPGDRRVVDDALEAA